MRHFMLKTLKIVVCLALIATCVIAIVILCHSYKLPPTTHVVVLRDVTDSFAVQPKPDVLLSLFALSEGERWNGAWVELADITDVSYNAVSSTYVVPANKWLSNELQRDKEIDRFKQHVTTLVDAEREDTTGRPYSSVYLAMAQQLVRLYEDWTEKRVLVVYSDLMENTPSVSFYDTRVLASLNERPDKVVQAWEAVLPLPTLAGIDVYLIYQPVDAADDARYQVVSGFYKKMLEAKGATVQVAANLSQ